jgi:hypothetical protein
MAVDLAFILKKFLSCDLEHSKADSYSLQIANGPRLHFVTLDKSRILLACEWRAFQELEKEAHDALWRRLLSQNWETARRIFPMSWCLSPNKGYELACSGVFSFDSDDSAAEFQGMLAILLSDELTNELQALYIDLAKTESSAHADNGASSLLPHQMA